MNIKKKKAYRAKLSSSVRIVFVIVVPERYVVLNLVPPSLSHYTVSL
jgi:hypothetical protein